MGPVRNRTGHPRVDQVGAVPHHPNRQDRCAARVDGSDVAVVGSSVPFATIALPIATGPARFPAFHFAARATVSADGWTTTASAAHSTRSKVTTDHSARGPTVRSSSAATAGKLRRSTRWPPGTASARSARARRSSRTDASSPPRRRTRASPIDKTTEAISPSPSIATASRAHAYVTLASACDQRNATRSRGSAIRIGTCFRTVAWTVTRAGGANQRLDRHVVGRVPKDEPQQGLDPEHDLPVTEALHQLRRGRHPQPLHPVERCHGRHVHPPCAGPPPAPRFGTRAARTLGGPSVHASSPTSAVLTERVPPAQGLGPPWES